MIFSGEVNGRERGRKGRIEIRWIVFDGEREREIVREERRGRKGRIGIHWIAFDGERGRRQELGREEGKVRVEGERGIHSTIFDEERREFA